MSRLLSRLGRFSARHRLAVILLWSLTLAALAATALLGMRFSDGGFTVPGTASDKAMSVLDSEFPSNGDGSASLQLVARTDSGTAISASDLSRALDDLRAVDGVEKVSNPFDPASPYISADGTTAVATIDVATGADPDAVTDEVSTIAAATDSSDLTVEVGGSIDDEAPEILGPGEIVGALLAFLVLVLTYGSLVAAGANMFGALLGVGVGILGVLAFSALTPIGTLTPVLAVMLGLAVGIDYCLFILSRFRSELREGLATEEAIGIAVGTAGTSVVFAGTTVIIALTGLLVVGIPFLGEMGLAAAFAVAVAVLMSLTLLPAFMGSMGRRVLPRGERGRRGRHAVRGSRVGGDRERGRFVDGWARFVTRHRGLSILGGVIVLTGMSVPVLSMTTALNIPGGEDPESSQRAAYSIVAEEFGDGAQDPIVVLAEAEDVQGHVPELQKQLSALDDVAAVIPSGVSSSGDVAMFTVMSEYGPLDERTEKLVHDLRTVDSDDAELLVTGVTAIGIDSDEQLRSALIVYLAIIIGFSLLLLLVLFRSVLVPIIATLGFLLSLGAGLGATVAIFQWGWLDALFSSPQGNPLLSLLPIVVTGILFGLAMDYQVFLVSRMHEAHRRGDAPTAAIRDGFARSAVVVIAAAVIMTAVFGGFAVSPSSLVGSIALALTVGVVADAFIVRMIITPALLSVLGRGAWWLPRWLDRLLPRIDAEGAALAAEQTNSDTDQWVSPASRA